VKSQDSSEHLLEVKNLTKSYDGKRVVNGVNIKIKRGEVVGLLGPNGAGKTTTFYMVVGMLKPDDGAIIFDGKNITKLAMFKRARNGIGYLSQEPSIFRKLSVEENIMAILETLDLPRTVRKKRLKDLLEELHITNLAKKRHTCFQAVKGAG